MQVGRTEAANFCDSLVGQICENCQSFQTLENFFMKFFVRIFTPLNFFFRTYVLPTDACPGVGPY